MINGGRRTFRLGERARVQLAARQATDLYPGTLGRLVAHELTAYAQRNPGIQSGGLAELVVCEVLDRIPPRGRRATARSTSTNG